MVDKRLILALIPLALLVACKDEVADEDDSRSASGEVLEGTISDAMLPLDRVRSEPPLEDPEAFAEVQEGTNEPAGQAAAAGDAEAAGDEADESEEEPAAEPAPEPAD